MKATIHVSKPTRHPTADLFGRIASWTIRASGGRWGFGGALAIVLAWAACGPYFRYSENWQLIINTGTTIVTFLMVFLIQNAQNRESKAVHLKLDELIRAVKTARNEMIDIENMTEEHLDELSLRYQKLARRHARDCGEHAEESAPHSPLRQKITEGQGQTTGID